MRLYHVNHKALSARFAHVGFGLENRHRSITWLDVAKGNLTGLCLSPMALCYPRFLLSVLYAGCYGHFNYVLLFCVHFVLSFGCSD